MFKTLNLLNHGILLVPKVACEHSPGVILVGLRWSLRHFFLFIILGFFFITVLLLLSIYISHPILNTDSFGLITPSRDQRWRGLKSIRPNVWFILERRLEDWKWFRRLRSQRHSGWDLRSRRDKVMVGRLWGGCIRRNLTNRIGPVYVFQVFGCFPQRLSTSSRQTLNPIFDSVKLVQLQ